MISKTWKHKLQLQEGEDERKWRTLDNHSIQTPLPLSHPTVCRCAIITMMAGPTIHIIHNFFLTLTLTKQNKMLSIVSVDHGNNMIVCRPGEREGRWDSSPCQLWHNVYRQYTEAREKFLIMIPPVNVATFQMFINYRHADTNIQS